MKKTIWAVLLLISIASTSYAQNGNKRGAHDIDAKTKAEVLKVLDDYMNTFNAKNLTAWEATYQFPHYRLASGNMSVLDKAGLRDSASVFVPLQKAGWDHSRWDHRNIVQASDIKVHVDTRFSRFKADGTKLGEYESLYVLTKENGRWGVKLRSSYAE